MHATDYLAQSHWHGFRYRVGEMVGLDREQRLVHVAPVVDEDGEVVALLRQGLQGEPAEPAPVPVHFTPRSLT